MPKRPSPPEGARLFGDAATDSKPAATTGTAPHRANIDGGSRGNPGPAAYGVVIRDPKGEIVARLKKFIGRMTNNVAEYYGLIAALDYVESQGIRALRIESDSELLVKQMKGLYKVRSEELAPLFERAKKMALRSIPSASITSTANTTAKPTLSPTRPWTKSKAPTQSPAAKEAAQRSPRQAQTPHRLRLRQRRSHHLNFPATSAKSAPATAAASSTYSKISKCPTASKSTSC